MRHSRVDLRQIDQSVRVTSVSCNTISLSVRRIDAGTCSPKPTCQRIVHARTEHQLVAIGLLIDDLTKAMDLSEQASLTRAESNLHDGPERPRFYEERATQRLECSIGDRGHEHRVR